VKRGCYCPGKARVGSYLVSFPPLRFRLSIQKTYVRPFDAQLKIERRKWNMNKTCYGVGLVCRQKGVGKGSLVCGRYRIS
jgi:hypothetical protein